MDADAVSQASHDQIETTNETTKNVNTTAPGPQPAPPPPSVVIAEEASVTEVDHKVTVTIQKPNVPETEVTVTEEDIRKQPQQPQPRESHVTVIKVQEETIKETKGKHTYLVITVFF